MPHSLVVILSFLAGCRVLADIQRDTLMLSETSPAPVLPHFTPAGSRLVFTAHSDAAGLELWSTDGTTPGTASIMDHNPGAGGSRFGSFTHFQNAAFYFVENTAATGDELWKSDGTAAGTIKLADFAGGVPGVHGGAVLGGTMYFCAPGNSELWKTNGTAAGTVKVKDLVRDFIAVPTPAAELIAVGGRVFIGARNMGLYVTDGTVAGTVKLTTATQATLLTAAGTGIVFRGAPGTSSSGELWKSDGTVAGTTALKAPGNVSVPPGTMLSTGTVAFFSSTAGGGGSELWKTDGTTAGTVRVKDIRPGTTGSVPEMGAVIGNKVCFIANDGTHGREPWVSDGTESGTVLLGDLQTDPGYPHTDVSAYALLDGKLWVAGSSGLFSTDGTAAGTLVTNDIFAYFAGLAPLGQSLIGYEEVFLFGEPESYAGTLWILTPDATPPPLGKPEITATGLNALGQFQMTFPTIAGYDYDIYSGSTPADMPALEFSIRGTGSDYTWTDPAAPSGRKYYRVERR